MTSHLCLSKTLGSSSDPQPQRQASPRAAPWLGTAALPPQDNALGSRFAFPHCEQSCPILMLDFKRWPSWDKHLALGTSPASWGPGGLPKWQWRAEPGQRCVTGSLGCGREDKANVETVILGDTRVQQLDTTW